MSLFERLRRRRVEGELRDEELHRAALAGSSEAMAEKSATSPALSLSLSEACERKPPERVWGKQSDPTDELQVAGIIHGLRVQKSKRDGKLYAQATLEDASGNFEIICFAREYDRLCENL